jgi:hypothetical protein
VGEIKLERIEAWEASTLTWGMAIEACTVFHWKTQEWEVCWWCEAGLPPVDDEARTDQEVDVEGFHGVLETDGICWPQNQDVVYAEDGPDSLNF